MLPSPDILNDFEQGKFVLSNLAAKRAAQLKGGAPALVNIQSTHPLTVALAEIAAGKVKAVMTSDLEVLEPQEEVAVLVGEDRPAELGFLLPALDESEAGLLDGVLAEDEDLGDGLLDASLTDLADDAEVEVVEADADTLSLSDIEAQENLDEADGDPDEV